MLFMYLVFFGRSTEGYSELQVIRSRVLLKDSAILFLKEAINVCWPLLKVAINRVRHDNLSG